MLIKHNRISALGERVLSLERALSEYDHDPSFIFIVQLSDFLVRNIEDLSSHNGSNQRDREPSSKKRKRDHFSRLESASNSARDDCSIGSTTHHAEQARVVIQGELDGNERMDLERKSILRSALQFVDVMAQGKTSNPDKSAPLDMPCEYPEDPPSSITPSAELLYMLLPGIECQLCFRWDALTAMQNQPLLSDALPVYNGQIIFRIKRLRKWL